MQFNLNFYVQMLETVCKWNKFDHFFVRCFGLNFVHIFTVGDSYLRFGYDTQRHLMSDKPMWYFHCLIQMKQSLLSCCKSSKLVHLFKWHYGPLDDEVAVNVIFEWEFKLSNIRYGYSEMVCMFADSCEYQVHRNVSSTLEHCRSVCSFETS